jgi:hypothetical protein
MSVKINTFGDPYMSTDDCKQFIASMAETYLLNVNDKWKRVRKYKDNALVLREFKSTSGDVLVISESADSVLGVYSLELVTTPLSAKAMSYLSKEKLLEELNNLSEEYSGKSEELDINPRSKELNCSYDFISQLIGDKLTTDVIFDLENTELTYYHKDDISYLQLDAGGDWEYPILAFFYWSEKNKAIKGFFPLGEGNTYNIETNTAYGSEDSNDDELTERYETIMNELDGDGAERIGFEQFKQHIERDYKNI